MIACIWKLEGTDVARANPVPHYASPLELVVHPCMLPQFNIQPCAIPMTALPIINKQTNKTHWVDPNQEESRGGEGWMEVSVLRMHLHPSEAFQSIDALVHAFDEEIDKQRHSDSSCSTNNNDNNTDDGDDGDDVGGRRQEDAAVASSKKYTAVDRAVVGCGIEQVPVRPRKRKKRKRPHDQGQAPAMQTAAKCNKSNCKTVVVANAAPAVLAACAEQNTTHVTRTAAGNSLRQAKPTKQLKSNDSNSNWNVTLSPALSQIRAALERASSSGGSSGSNGSNGSGGGGDGCCSGDVSQQNMSVADVQSTTAAKPKLTPTPKPKPKPKPKSRQKSKQAPSRLSSRGRCRQSPSLLIRYLSDRRHTICEDSGEHVHTYRSERLEYFAHYIAGNRDGAAWFSVPDLRQHHVATSAPVDSINAMLRYFDDMLDGTSEDIEDVEDDGKDSGEDEGKSKGNGIIFLD